MTDIERLTQAAIKQLSKDHPYEYAYLMYDSVMSLDGHFDIEKLVCAILSELRKPSERMLRSAGKAEYHQPTKWQAQELRREWQAMLDSITEEDEAKAARTHPARYRHE